MGLDVRSELENKKCFLSFLRLFFFSPGGHTTAVSPPLLMYMWKGIAQRVRLHVSIPPLEKGSDGRTGGDRERAADSWRDEPVTL